MKRICLVLALIALLSAFAAKAQQGNKASISDSIDVLHYDIHLRMVNLSTKRISGYTDVEIAPLVNGITSFRLWLQSLSVDSIRINGTPATFIDYNDTLMRVGLPVSMGTADTFTARIYYHGLPVTDPSTWGGFYFTSDSNFAYNLGVGFESVPHNYGRVWFPCIDDFVDRATYDCYITTKSDKMAVCGGTLISGTDHGDGTKTWHWNLQHSIPTYLASVAVGPYVPVNGTFSGMLGNIPTALYVRASDTNATKASFIHLNDMLSVFENRFGPYRWERVGYVGVPFNSGAMEHVTNIAYPLACLTGTLGYEDLSTHELSHMWFGDLVTCATAEDMWINEGWASYCEAIFKEGYYGRASYNLHVRNNHKSVVQFSHVEDNGYRALYGIPPEYTYSTTVYDKGADVAHTLRGYLGDSLFFPAMQNYFTDYAFNHISSIEMRDYLSVQTGVDLTSFFDAWVFAPGFPHFSIDSFNVSGNGPCNVTVNVRQRLNHAPAMANDNILDVTFMNAMGNEFTDTIHFSGALGQKIFTVPFVPAAVILDKYDKISDALTSNSMVIKTIGSKDFLTTYCVLDVTFVTDSAWVRVEHNFVPPDPLKTTNADIKRLSDYRYWKVDGLFPTGFVAKAKFRYNRSTSATSGYLDNIFMPTTTSKDSLLLLYRQGPGDEWQIEPALISGTSSTGDLIVDVVKRGEYTLAIASPAHFGIPNQRGGKQGGLNVYPNPSSADFTIDWTSQDAVALQMFDANGQLKDAINISGKQAPLRWSPGNKAAGTYVLKLYNERQEIIGQEKIIYLP
jgi:hypothetical protein